MVARPIFAVRGVLVDAGLVPRWGRIDCAVASTDQLGSALGEPFGRGESVMPLAGCLGTKSRLWLITPVALLTLVLAACGGGGDAPSVGDEGGGAGAGNDAAGTDEPITLMVADKEPGGAPNEVLNVLIEQFMAEHPNVTIERDTQGPADYDATINLRATSDSPPDVFQVPLGFKGMGPLVEVDALVSLEDYADQYGWVERFGEGLLQGNRFSSDGMAWGEGDLWGVSMGGEVQGVYYDQAKLDDLGIDVPATFSEFEAALQAVKEAGELPVMFGNVPPAHGLILSMTVQDNFVTRDQRMAWLFGQAGASYEDPGYVEAAATLQQWAQREYFPVGYDGVAYEDALQRFASGDGVFLITGSWANATLTEPMGDDLRFMAMPPPEVGGTRPVSGSTDAPFVISSNTSHPDLAAEFLDLITGPAAAEILIEAGDIPAGKFDAGNLDSVPDSYADILRTWEEVLNKDLLTNNIGQAGPAVPDAVFAGIQELMAGRISPEDYVSRVQDAWEQTHGQ